MKKDSAISEMVGALTLIGVLVILAAIILSILVSFYPPEILPDPRIDIYNETYTHGLNTIYITSLGGNPLPENSYFVKVHTVNGEYLDRTSIVQPVVASQNKDIKTGNRLYFEDPGFQTAIVDIIHRYPGTGKETLMFRKKLIDPDTRTITTPFVQLRIMVRNSDNPVVGKAILGSNDPIIPGPYQDFSTSGEVPLFLEGAVIKGIWVAPGQIEDPELVKSMGSYISDPEGRIKYTYNLDVNENLTVLIDFRNPIIKIFNIGGDGTVTGTSSIDAVSLVGSGFDELSRNIDESGLIDILGINGGTIDDLRFLRGNTTSGDVLANGAQISLAIGSTSYSFSLPDDSKPEPYPPAPDEESQDFTVAVQFSGTDPSRTVRAINLGPGGIIRYGGDTVLSGYNQNLFVPQSGSNDVLIQGQTGYHIKKLTYIPGIFPDESTVWSDPLHVNITDAEGQSSYSWSVPEGPDDYTIVAEFYSDTYRTIRVINQGPDGIVTGNGDIINPGDSRDIPVLDGDSFNLEVNSQGERVIDTIAYLGSLTNQPSIVLNTGTILNDASSQSHYSYLIDEVRNDHTFVVNFSTPQYTIRVFNVGDGEVVIGDVTIEADSFQDFTFASGEEFSAFFDGQGLNRIEELKYLTSIAPDSATVFSTGTSIDGAVGEETFTHTINPVTSNYSLAVRFDPILYTIDASACTGGTITDPGIRTYPPGATPEYTISATGLNRAYQLLIDGVSVSFPSGTREYTYQFEPLTGDHTIRVVFAINGARGNYWGDAYINVFISTPGQADMTRTVRSGSRSGPPIESTTAWNTQIHPYINLADPKAMADHSSGSTGARPYYTTLETGWPNRVSPTVGREGDLELFYVNWSGLMFLEQPGSYTFWTRCDDGMKLFIDGNLITNDARAWVKEAPPAHAWHYSCTTNPSTVLPGWHSYSVWMYENLVHAVADLRFQPPGQTQTNPADNPSVPFFRDLYYLPDSC